MDCTTHRGNHSQRGFIRAVSIPYLLLALALLALIYFWNALQQRDSAIAQIEESNSEQLAELDRKVQEYDVEINELKGNFQALETENGELKEQVVSLKREASHARAQIQRTQPLLDKRTELIDELKNQKVSNGILADKLKAVPELKSELSYARADNQRARHVQAARDNLIGQLQIEKALNSGYQEQLSGLPELKYELSSANAENARLQHVAAARENLMHERAAMKKEHSREIELKNKTNLAIAKKLQEIPVLKKELSFARAENQRAMHISAARDNLRQQLLDVRQTGSVENGIAPALQDQFARIREENEKLQSLSKSLDQAIVDTLSGIQN